jgi:hypothetical protein
MNYQFWRLFLALDERHLVEGVACKIAADCGPTGR